MKGGRVRTRWSMASMPAGGGALVESRIPAISIPEKTKLP